MIWLAGLTILKNETCLGIMSGCGGDPVVELRLRNAADYIPAFFLAAWHQTRAFLISVNNKVIFLAGLTILKKERCLSILSACGVDPVVALRLRNTADYRKPTFGPHGTKLGHS